MSDARKRDVQRFRIWITPERPAAPGDSSAPGTDIALAIQQQLGLRLVANKATLDVVIVDKAERVPTAN